MHTNNFKMLLWLDYRAFHKKGTIEERNDFLVMNSNLEIEYDTFKVGLERDYILFQQIICSFIGTTWRI